jgi:death-on-curing family protein
VDVIAPLEWEILGHERDCHGPSVEQVSMIHEELVSDFAASKDPISPSGVKSPAMLESAVHRPDTANGNMRKYPTVEMAAAALLHALVHNHPFHNGNKRTALVAMIVFIDEHGLVLTANENELFKLVLQLAQHALVDGDRGDLPDREVLAVARWLKSRVRWKERGDRALPWRELRRILTELGCQCEAASRGQRMTVTRRLARGSTWLGRKRTVTLTSTFTNVQDGRDVDRNIVSRLRHDLELDDTNGVDSAAFYADAALSTSDFIRSYQGLLRRLAKV